SGVENFAPLSLGDQILFPAVTLPNNEFVTWISDGYTASTLYPPETVDEVRLSGISQGVFWRGRVFCAGANLGGADFNLAISDGTPGGTQLIADPDPRTDLVPAAFAATDSFVFFQAS